MVRVSKILLDTEQKEWREYRYLTDGKLFEIFSQTLLENDPR